MGTSGFSYPEWKGTFYPAKLPQAKFLSYYAEQFPTTELNITFYRMPRENLVASWSAATGDTFRFALKLNRWITHHRKLFEADESMERFLDEAGRLGPKLGPILVQLPPTFKKDLDVLGHFASTFSSRAPLAFEFRHDSWMEDDVFNLLREQGSSFVVSERDPGRHRESPKIVTGKFAYVRLRKSEYSDKELRSWAGWMRDQTVDVYCYVKHEDGAPELAKRLLNELG